MGNRAGTNHSYTTLISSLLHHAAAPLPMNVPPLDMRQHTQFLAVIRYTFKGIIAREGH